MWLVSAAARVLKGDLISLIPTKHQRELKCGQDFVAHVMHTLPETNSSSLKIGLGPQKEIRLNQSLIFKGF